MGVTYGWRSLGNKFTFCVQCGTLKTAIYELKKNKNEHNYWSPEKTGPASVGFFDINFKSILSVANVTWGGCG